MGLRPPDTKERPRRMDTKLDFTILPQPDQITCGPTCLHSVYNYYGDPITLPQVIDEMNMLKTGGTLGVFLGCHALRRGYKARIYSYNLHVFDPTWFNREEVDISERLKRQMRHKHGAKLRMATNGYLDFLELGGEIRMEDLRPNLVRKYLKRGIPILTGLSSTYLYRTPREYGPHDDYNDIRGHPSGHFVVLYGYNQEEREVRVADPLKPNPAFQGQLYSLPVERVINSILLGIVTYDANLLLIWKPEPHPEKKGHKKDTSHE